MPIEPTWRLHETMVGHRDITTAGPTLQKWGTAQLLMRFTACEYHIWTISISYLVHSISYLIYCHIISYMTNIFGLLVSLLENL